MLPKDIQILIPEAVNVTEQQGLCKYDQGLCILKWGDYPELPEKYNHKCPDKREIDNILFDTKRGEGDVMMEAVIAVMQFEDRGRGEESRNTGGHQQIKQTGKRILL